ncbi:MAG: hypothetical protein ACREOM_08545 [Candidatus Dormibacteraceae bacterium]
MKTTVVAAFASIALIPASAIGVFAYANPNNHGHHYGQLKHRPGVPAQAPRPESPPVVPAVRLVTGVTPIGGAAAQIISLPTVAPAAGVPGGYKLVRSVPTTGVNPWLILALLVSGASLWLYVFYLLARSATRRQRQPRIQPAV